MDGWVYIADPVVNAAEGSRRREGGWRREIRSDGAIWGLEFSDHDPPEPSGRKASANLRVRERGRHHLLPGRRGVAGTDSGSTPREWTERGGAPGRPFLLSFGSSRMARRGATRNGRKSLFGPPGFFSLVSDHLHHTLKAPGTGAHPGTPVAWVVLSFPSTSTDGGRSAR